MKINSLKIEGFRGVKKEVDLWFPLGFIVISGRNGSGKSTICDAIEYALTGSIRTGGGHKEKGESIEDYLWWRGSGRSEKKYVSLGLIDDAGEQVIITRSPHKVEITNENKIDELVSDPSCSPKDCLQQLCRTSILRDEEITQLSIDLPERDRFDFVRSAIAATDFSDIEEKTKTIQKILKEQFNKFEQEYNESRKRINDLTVRLSSRKTETEKFGDIKDAELQLRELLDHQITDETDIMEITRKAVTELRSTTDNLFRIIIELNDLLKQLEECEKDDTNQKKSALEKEIASLGVELNEVDKKLEDLDAEIDLHKKESPKLSSLAEIAEHGKRYGLEEGHCPLCNSEVSENSYYGNISSVQARLQSASDRLSKLVKEKAEAADGKRSTLTALDSKKEELKELSSQSQVILKKIDLLKAESEGYGFSVSEGKEFTSVNLTEYAEIKRKIIISLERNLAILESSIVYDQVAEMEKEIKVAKNHSTEVEKRMNEVSEAENQAKKAINVIKRVSGEIVDERLAQLSPLISELYYRLRPHLDWEDVSYHVRGDVRRFLSFEVGDGLNPSFMFSSGQRRAAGLAFLLAVHLSRHWCKLNTLILDDPVQHIDDYRALQLTEVLSVIRKSGKQILCTVEDDALAKLLCRRLRGSNEEEGCLISMSYDSELGVHSNSIRTIPPLPTRLLLSA